MSGRVHARPAMPPSAVRPRPATSSEVATLCNTLLGPLHAALRAVFGSVVPTAPAPRSIDPPRTCLVLGSTRTWPATRAEAYVGRKRDPEAKAFDTGSRHAAAAAVARANDIFRKGRRRPRSRLWRYIEYPDEIIADSETAIGLHLRYDSERLGMFRGDRRPRERWEDPTAPDPFEFGLRHALGIAGVASAPATLGVLILLGAFA